MISPSNEPPALIVDSLVKDFRVYHRSYGSLKTHAAALAKSLAGRKREPAFEVRRILNGVSFVIPRGQAVALLGKNGSGKSTLLSILSRVYLPTSGTVTLHGRMTSLLELGVGFHQELTGAENVFFSGAISGLNEDELEKRFDDIVTFSGLDPASMDLPVRMYSSGMQMRLGFAMAIHLDSDIVLIDEGLAVGDEGFQEKCFEKLGQMKKNGCTILMVTHELDHIERLADRVLWLQDGHIVVDDTVEIVLPQYRSSF